ncbi:MAG TPA: SgcJ/EcaC family oxidoreductase, partial [Gemmataceae bacterium]
AQHFQTGGVVMHTRVVLFAAAALAAAVGLAVGWGVKPGSAVLAQEGKAAKAAAPGEGDKEDARAADRAAIRKGVDSFIKAFESGDAKAVASHWTAQGEYIGEDGTTLRGRDAIEKAYADLFARDKGLRVEVEVLSLRFPSRDSAVEEGLLWVRKGGKGKAASARYSALHVREDGAWRMALVREWPSEAASVRELAWLVGTWEAGRDGEKVRTTYDWYGGKAFIRGEFTIAAKGRTAAGFQMIGRDPTLEQLRSWTFEEGGGFGAANWSRDGNKWLIESAGVLPDGSVMTAVNILTRIDDDTFTWQSTARTIDGEPAPDIPPVRVTRVRASE